MITKRDEAALEFIEKFRVAKTSAISSLFYPSVRVAQIRLATLCGHGVLKREHDTYGPEFIYYIKKPANLRHALLLSDFYVAFSLRVEIRNFAIEPEVLGIRPDALTAYIEGGKPQVAFVEIEISNKGFDIGKYERLKQSGEYRKSFPMFPRLIVVTDKKVPQSPLDIVIIPTDLSTIKKPPPG